MDKLAAFPMPGWAEKGDSNILPLTLKNVSYEVSGMRLIKDLNASFDADQLTVIIGPNGAGKSLLLRLCHGLIKPSVGKIFWNGPSADTPNLYQAMVFQRPIMLRRSVVANIKHALNVRSENSTKATQTIEYVLHQTGLTRLAKVPARQLSVGEQQRLALARAWSLNPEVLFMDEPTAALDPAATYSLEEIILTIKNTGTKIIMSTQDLGQARRLADDVLFIYRGRLLERAEASIFFNQPKNDLAQAFLRGELLWWNRQELKPIGKFKEP